MGTFDSADCISMRFLSQNLDSCQKSKCAPESVSLPGTDAYPVLWKHHMAKICKNISNAVGKANLCIHSPLWFVQSGSVLRPHGSKLLEEYIIRTTRSSTATVGGPPLSLVRSFQSEILWKLYETLISLHIYISLMSSDAECACSSSPCCMDRRLSGSSSPPHISALHARHLEDP